MRHPSLWGSVPLLRTAGALQMQLDLSLCRGVGEGSLPPLLRFFLWDPPALSLGYPQSPQGDVRLPACHAANVSLITRPTGGRAVFHRDELSYSLFLPRPYCSSVREIYARTGEAMGRALQMLGGDVSWGRVPERDEMSGAEEPWCFWNGSPYDVYTRGKKLTGMAQRRWRDVLLLQGSLLLDFHPEALLPLLHWRTVATEADLLSRAGSVRECLGTLPPMQDILAAVQKGIEEAWGISVQEREFPPAEGEKPAVTVGYP